MTFTMRAPGGPRNRMKFTEPGLTEQQHVESCDIKNILKKYKDLGVNPHVLPDESAYFTVPDSVDYAAAANMVAEAHSMFEELPSQLREQFDNDAIRMMDFLTSDPDPEDLEALGLVLPTPDPLPGGHPKTPVNPPQSAPSANPAPPASEPPNEPL